MGKILVSIFIILRWDMHKVYVKWEWERRHLLRVLYELRDAICWINISRCCDFWNFLRWKIFQLVARLRVVGEREKQLKSRWCHGKWAEREKNFFPSNSAQFWWLVPHLCLILASSVFLYAKKFILKVAKSTPITITWRYHERSLFVRMIVEKCK